jgi:hypothetical protein
MNASRFFDMRQMTLAGRSRVIREGLAAGRTVRVFSLSYRLLGAVLILLAFVLAVFIASTAGNGQNSYADDWVGFNVVLLTLGLGGWLYLARAYMDVGPAGIRIVNPINESFIPWASIVDVRSDGVSLRIRTATWSVGAFGVEKANREVGGRSGAESVAAVLTEEALRRRDEARTDLAGDVDVTPWKRWWHPWAALITLVGLSAAGWVFYVALHAGH